MVAAFYRVLGSAFMFTATIAAAIHHVVQERQRVVVSGDYNMWHWIYCRHLRITSRLLGS